MHWRLQGGHPKECLLNCAFSSKSAVRPAILNNSLSIIPYPGITYGEKISQLSWYSRNRRTNPATNGTFTAQRPQLSAIRMFSSESPWITARYGVSWPTRQYSPGGRHSADFSELPERGPQGQLPPKFHVNWRSSSSSARSELVTRYSKACEASSSHEISS